MLILQFLQLLDHVIIIIVVQIGIRTDLFFDFLKLTGQPVVYRNLDATVHPFISCCLYGFYNHRILIPMTIYGFK